MAIEEELEVELAYAWSPRYVLSRQLMRGEIEDARAILESWRRRRWRAATKAPAVTVVGTRACSSGSQAVGGRHSITPPSAHELAEQTQYQHARGWEGRVKALIEADLGLSRRHVPRPSDAWPSPDRLDRVVHDHEPGPLGRLEFALDDLEAAGGYLRDLPERLVAAGNNDPTLPVWADTIETLVALGELARAREYLEPYALRARIGSPWALAAAGRCRGLLCAAGGRARRRLRRIRARSGRRWTSTLPAERGRTLLCLGTVRRQAQQKKAAREALEQALAIFEDLGARLWAEKARASSAGSAGAAGHRRS